MQIENLFIIHAVHEAMAPWLETAEAGAQGETARALFDDFTLKLVAVNEVGRKLDIVAQAVQRAVAEARRQDLDDQQVVLITGGGLFSGAQQVLLPFDAEFSAHKPIALFEAHQGRLIDLFGRQGGGAVHGFYTGFRDYLTAYEGVLERSKEAVEGFDVADPATHGAVFTHSRQLALDFGDLYTASYTLVGDTLKALGTGS